MAICIAGMHRSGTSLVARLLNLCGLYLGREQDILPPNPTNPEGHWEHERIMEINDELLAEFGGGWDYPPDLAGLADRSRIAPIEPKARPVLEDFAGREFWGWKDPRNCLTLPFWRPLVGRMTVVICVRNPLEVAFSLRRRGASSLSFGLSLWTAYNEAVLHATSPQERVVTNYLRYLSDPVAEIRRLAAKMPFEFPSSQTATLAETTKTDSRHHAFSARDLVTFRLSPRVVDLYRRLCTEADVLDEADALSGASTAAEPAGRFDYAALERYLVRSRD